MDVTDDMLETWPEDFGLTVDASRLRNPISFINDFRMEALGDSICEEDPLRINVEWNCVLVDGLPYMVALQVAPVAAHDEFLCDYGFQYWRCLRMQQRRHAAISKLLAERDEKLAACERRAQSLEAEVAALRGQVDAHQASLRAISGCVQHEVLRHGRAQDGAAQPWEAALPVTQPVEAALKANPLDHLWESMGDSQEITWLESLARVEHLKTGLGATIRDEVASALTAGGEGPPEHYARQIMNCVNKRVMTLQNAAGPTKRALRGILRAAQQSGTGEPRTPMELRLTC
eukprot:gene28812-35779_t